MGSTRARDPVDAWLMKIGKDDYRLAGLERLKDSGVLLRKEAFSGSVYLAGRAVESMLRAVVWKTDAEIQTGVKSLETGHDLRELLLLVQDLGVLRDNEHRADFAAKIQYVSRLWFNNLRFVSTDRLEKHWWKLHEVRRKRTLKQAAEAYYDMCSSIVKRFEALCVN